MQLVNVNHGHYLHFIDEGVGGSAIWPRSPDRKWGELGFEPSNVASCSFVSLVLGSSGVGEGSSAEEPYEVTWDGANVSCGGEEVMGRSRKEEWGEGQ